MSDLRRNENLTPGRLARKAIVYLRQSTERQVLHNKESQRLQYALADYARSLGWADVEVIDSDLGSSAAIGATSRIGFERLLAQVALGGVGVVLSREVSRLSRTDKDWCHLLELCQLFDTLIADHEHIYDLSLIDDQLILGIKGTMSVVELKVLRMRMQQGMEEKARRGELMRVLPPGYVFDGTHTVVKDPDIRVREAIDLIFRKFREKWSVRGVLKWFRDHGVEVPVNKARGGRFKIIWQLPTHSFIGTLLRNPFYAGAYFYGQRQAEVALVDGRPIKRRGRRRDPEECRVFIRDHHEGYITWDTHMEIKKTIQRNAVGSATSNSMSAVRTGHALLSGILRCGACGRKLHVYYSRNDGGAHYRCVGTHNSGGSRCISFSARRADRCISDEILRAISPLAVQAALRAADRVASASDDRLRPLQRQKEQVEYEAQRAFEQFNEVDPRHRLVAADLERRWNAKLDEVERLKVAIADLEHESRELTEAERATLLALGQRFGSIWSSSECPPDLKKKIVRSIVEEIIVTIEDRMLRLVIHWTGGVHTTTGVPNPRPGETERTADDDLEVIRKMAPSYGDHEIARVLSKLGRRTGKRNPWTAKSVATARWNHNIPGHTAPVIDDDVLSLARAAKYCAVSNTTIKRLVRSGILKCTQITTCAPWEIRKADLETAPVRKAIEGLRATGRLDLAGEDSGQHVLQLE